MADLEPGSRFGRYRIERLVGRGGYGTVYVAQDTNPHLPRRVALKVLGPNVADKPSFRDRFLRESLMAIELDPHPSIVPVYDAGEEAGTLYIAMRFIDGTDLASALARGPLTAEHAASLIGQVASALDVAHAAGLVHRDVKPGNILLSSDLQHAYLADFGITKQVGDDRPLTQTGEFLGTLNYAAPEQLEGKQLDGRTDEYSLGCVLYECLTASPPFGGELNAIVTAHLTRPVPPVTDRNPAVPPIVDDVIATATAKNPDDRYRTCGELALALTRALTQGAEPAPPDTRPASAGVTAQVARAPAPGPGGRPPGPGGTEPPAPPPPGPGRSGGAARRILVGAGALVAVGVAVVLILVLTGGQGGGFPNAGERSLLGAIPSGARTRCTRDDAGLKGGATDAAISCVPAAGADRVSFVRFTTSQAADDAYTRQRKARNIAANTEGDCADFTDVASSFSTTDGDSGSLFCYRRGGSSYVVWTSRERIVAKATRAGTHDLALYRWWSTLVGRTLTGPQQDLLDLLPTSVDRSHCADGGGGDTIKCKSPSASVEVLFVTSYRTLSDLQSAYAGVLSTNSIQSNSTSSLISAGTCPGEEGYLLSGAAAGRVACYRAKSDNFFHVVWTIDAKRALADVAGQSSASVVQFFTSTGIG